MTVSSECWEGKPERERESLLLLLEWGGKSNARKRYAKARQNKSIKLQFNPDFFSNIITNKPPI